VDQALRDLTKERALQTFRDGRMTLREFAEVLRLDAWAAQDLLAAEGVAVAQGGRGETAGALARLLPDQPVSCGSPPPTCQSPPVDEIEDLEARRAAWQRQQQRARRERGFGLLVFALGVLVLVYVALVASGR
jgi:hypothetical protein